MKILCPTDFSRHSKIALEYAINLANDIGATIHILSVYQVNKSSTSFMSMDTIIRENTEEDMKQLLAGLGPLIKKDNLPVTKVAKGETVSIILQYAKQLEMDLIVMGTQGDSSMRTILFGSTTRKLSQKTNIPVLAIPEEVAHRLTSNRFVLSLDDKMLKDENVFKVPKEIAEKLNLKIDILHIVTENKDMPFDPFISEYLGDLLGELHLTEGKDPVVEIKKFVEKENVGMLMMIRREKSFWKQLFTKGNTSEEIAKTNIPLLIIPE